LLTDEQKDELRKKFTADNQKLMDELAPLYVGRTCPFLGGECKGPACMVFLPTGEGNKITGGACSIPMSVSAIGSVVNMLGNVAGLIDRTAHLMSSQNPSRIIK